MPQAEDDEPAPTPHGSKRADSKSTPMEEESVKEQVKQPNPKDTPCQEQGTKVNEEPAQQATGSTREGDQKEKMEESPSESSKAVVDAPEASSSLSTTKDPTDKPSTESSKESKKENDAAAEVEQSAKGKGPAEDIKLETNEAKASEAYKTPPTSPSAIRSREHRRNVSAASQHEHHRRRSSLNTVTGNSPGSVQSAGVSEWSHQQLAPRQEQDISEEEEDEWQEMPAYAPYDIYDDDNKLVARENEIEGGGPDGYLGIGTSGPKGYTKVLGDDDAQSATSMDDNTAYLFKERGTHLDEEDDEGRDPLDQMRATKNLLDENQRIAYVGVVRLAMVEIAKDLSSMERTRGNRKQLDLAVEAMKLWSQKMMVRLYSHMDISPPEQLMIEQLAEHGLMAKDLTPSIMHNSRVKNPLAEYEKARDGHPEGTNGTDEAADGDEKNGDGAEKTSTTIFSNAEADKADRDVESEETANGQSSEAPPPYQETEDNVPEAQIPSQLPSTSSLEIDLRWTVLCDLFLILVLDSVYDSRSRVLLEKVGSYLDVPWLDICRFEKRVTEALEMQETAEKETWDEKTHMEHREKMARRRRLMFMGIATVGGGLVIGLSAGLLAPVIGAGLAAGFTTIGVSGTSTVLASTGAAAVIGTGGAFTGGAIGVRAAHRRTGAVRTYEYRPLHNNKRLNLVISVAGWMTGKVDDVRLPFSTVNPLMGDMYSIHWEPEMLTSMGATINILATEALTQGLQQLLGSTILIPLMAALQVPIILTKLAYLIDNPWSTSLARADQAGLILADSLIDRNLGARPITLVGFSLGSRVIFTALRELASKGAIGIIQNVYLFGSPVVVKKDEYLRAKTIVSGRFVNGYTTNDWILGYLFRATGGGISRVAGLAKVDILGIENVDVTEHVKGHMEYRKAMPRILQEVGWAVDSLEFTEIEDPDPDNHERRQRELINEIEEARKELQDKPEKRSFWLLRKNKKRAEKKAWETYDDRIIGMDESKDPAAEANPDGALFDLEALRKEVLEIAAQGIEIKELESTMPPMKVTLDSEQSSPKRPASLRETKSYSGSAPSSLNGYMASPASRSADTRPVEPETEKDGAEENVTMTFGPALPARLREPSPKRELAPSPVLPDDNPPRPSATFDRNRSFISSPNISRSPSPRKSQSPGRPTEQNQPQANEPELVQSHKSHQPPMNEPFPRQAYFSVDYNAWADDDDAEFGKEQEVQMTFE